MKILGVFSESLLLIPTILFYVNGINVSIKKCCPEGESLDLSTNLCKIHASISLPSTIQGLNLSRSLKEERIVELDLTFSNIGKPSCEKLEQHFIQFVNTNTSYTRYGSRCKSKCEKKSEDYFWCSTEDGWEYCSPTSKHTINNQDCDGSCSNEGTNYFWCWISSTKEDIQNCNHAPQWDYCSPQVKGKETWLTVKGSIVTSRYESTFPHGDFCIDNFFSSNSDKNDFTEDERGVVSLICDPCEGDKKCMNLCCPHGEAFKEDSDKNGGFPKCMSHGETIPWDPEFWNHEDNTIIHKERNNDYILVSENNHGQGFECPTIEEPLVPAETDIATFKILKNSSLKAEYSPDPDLECSGEGSSTDCGTTSTDLLTPDRYCLYFGKDPMDYSYDYGDLDYEGSSEDGDPQQTTELSEDHEGSGVAAPSPPSVNVFSYMYCQKKEEPETGELFTRDFYPVALLISCFFLLLTLLVYGVESVLRSGLFGKLTMGFIINLFIGYLSLSIISLANFTAESKGCVLIGYITQYTFLSFFFWVNAITVFICYKCTRGKKTSPRPDRERRCFLKFLLYAQGSPLIIILITFLADRFGQQAACSNGSIVHSATASLPNMGVFSCFLGSQFSQDQSFFTKPEFIYFQFFLLLLNFINIICFTITVYKMSQIQNENSSIAQHNKKRENIFVALKLFIIMGIPWIFEFISSLLAHNHGSGSTFWIRIFLDLPNLFTGLLIFLVLVCKKKILISLLAKVKGAAHLSTNTVQWDSATRAWMSFSLSSDRDEDGLPLADIQPEPIMLD